MALANQQRTQSTKTIARVHLIRIQQGVERTNVQKNDIRCSFTQQMDPSIPRWLALAHKHAGPRCLGPG